VKSIAIVDPEASLLIAGENGIGKRSSFEDYRLQTRGGSGVIALKTSSVVTGSLSVREGDEIMMLTEGGQAVRSPVKDIRVIGRATQGVRLINLKPGDKLIGLCRVVEVEDANGDDDDASDEGDDEGSVAGDES